MKVLFISQIVELIFNTTDCGSSLYTVLEVMPGTVCVKAGGIDDKDVRDLKKTSVEFYCKDRMAYSKAVEGAEQKPVSLSYRLILLGR